MPVDLKNIPETCIRPTPPRLSRWMGVFVILVGLSIFLSRLLTGKNNMWLSVGVPGLVVGASLLILFLIYLLRQIFANAWDKQREKTIIQEVRRGRRVLQILAAECCTAHSSADAPFASVASNLLRNENVLFPQRSWRGEENIRLSQLARTAGMSEESHLELLFTALAKQLALRFALLPENKPVRLIFESSSSLPEEQTEAIWWRAWESRGITQPCSRISVSGMQPIDHWLDHNIQSEDLLLVVSCQYAAADTALSAEAVSGVLMGNRLTQHLLPPIAFLHRPEQVGESSDAFEYAIRQALDWVPVTPEVPEHLWLSGMTAETDEYLTLMKAISSSSLSSIEPQTRIHNFNDFMGNPGKGAAWIAVAAAAQAIQQHPAHHLLICHEQQNGKVWNMVVSPVDSIKESGV